MPIGTSDGEHFEDGMAYRDARTSSTRPLGGSTEPAGAFNSDEGSIPSSVNPSTGRIMISPHDPIDYDYDAWKKANPGAEMTPGQHYPDTYKLPNHMTFSDESIYHGQNGAQGGHWGTDEQGNDTFTPGRTNLEQHTMGELRDYFQRVEPNAKLLPPDINDVPHHDWVESLGKGIYESAKSALTAPGDAWAGRFDPTSGEGVARALDMAGWMVGAPAPVAKKLADGTLGSFAGVRSATADKGALQTAKDALEQGVHPDEVFKKTGWFKGNEGQWKYEIDDSKSGFRPEMLDVSNYATQKFKDAGIALDTTSSGGKTTYGLRKWKTDVPVNPSTLPSDLKSAWDALHGKRDFSVKLPEVLDHPELFESYPRLKNLDVVPDKSFGNSAQFARGSGNGTIPDRVTIGYDALKDQGTLLHEVQHAIQSIEGFAKGGAPGKQGTDFTTKLEDALRDGHFRYNWLLEKLPKTGLLDSEVKELENLHKAFVKLPDYYHAANVQAWENYRRLAGEVEANNVDTRLRMDARSRQMVPPWRTEEYPADQQFIQKHPVTTDPYMHDFTPGVSKAADAPLLTGGTAKDDLMFMAQLDPKWYETMRKSPNLEDRRDKDKSLEGLDPAEIALMKLRAGVYTPDPFTPGEYNVLNKALGAQELDKMLELKRGDLEAQIKEQEQVSEIIKKMREEDPKKWEKATVKDIYKEAYRRMGLDFSIDDQGRGQVKPMPKGKEPPDLRSKPITKRQK